MLTISSSYVSCMCHAFRLHSGLVHDIPPAFVLHHPNVASQCHNNVKPPVPRRGDGNRGRPQLSPRQCCDPKIATFSLSLFFFLADRSVRVMSTSVKRLKIKGSAAFHQRSCPQVKQRKPQKLHRSVINFSPLTKTTVRT